MVLNVPKGFQTKLSFYYAAAIDGEVDIYAEENLGGKQLAKMKLNKMKKPCLGISQNYYCEWTKVEVPFDGTAKSVDFKGASDHIAFDDLYFGIAKKGTFGDPHIKKWNEETYDFHGK